MVDKRWARHNKGEFLSAWKGQETLCKESRLKLSPER